MTEPHVITGCKISVQHHLSSLDVCIMQLRAAQTSSGDKLQQVKIHKCSTFLHHQCCIKAASSLRPPQTSISSLGYYTPSKLWGITMKVCLSCLVLSAFKAHSPILETIRSGSERNHPGWLLS